MTRKNNRSASKRASRARVSRFRLFLINGAVVLGAILVVLLFFEIVLRVTPLLPTTIPTTKYDPYYVYRFNPGVSQDVYSSDLNKSILSTYNELGWLGPLSEYSINRTKPVRILVIGDSFSSQLNLESYNDHYSKQLEAMYPNVEVITIGVGSYAFDNEAKILEIEGARYKPDIVIFQTFMNDVMDSYRDNVFSMRNDTLVDNTPRTIPFLRKAIFQCWTHSRVCGVAANIVAQRGEAVNQFMTFLGISDIKRESDLHYRLWGMPDDLFMNTLQPPSVTSAYHKVDLIIQRDRALANERGYRLYYMLVPIKEQISERKRREFFAQNPDLNASSFDFGKPYDDIKGIMIRDNVTVIDLAPAFMAANTDNDFYYEIDGHWNVHGHTLAAQIVAQAIQPALDARK